MPQDTARRDADAGRALVYNSYPAVSDRTTYDEEGGRGEAQVCRLLLGAPAEIEDVQPKLR